MPASGRGPSRRFPYRQLKQELTAYQDKIQNAHLPFTGAFQIRLTLILRFVFYVPIAPPSTLFEIFPTFFTAAPLYAGRRPPVHSAAPQSEIMSSRTTIRDPRPLPQHGRPAGGGESRGRRIILSQSRQVRQVCRVGSSTHA